MTKQDRLNAASDLKRIAYWLAVGDRTKARLMNQIWEKDYRKFTSIKNPEKALNNKVKRLSLAEELLFTSLKLQYQ